MPTPRCELSIVVSVYNEEAVLDRFWAELARVLATMPGCEVLFVDDGSTDRGSTVLARIAAADPRVSVIMLSRNFGHEAAMIAGIDAAAGRAVVVMDADLQHPPSMVPAMLERYRSGHDIVMMARSDNKGVSWLSKNLSALFYRLINRIAHTAMVPNASDFFLVSDRVAAILRTEYRERVRFLRGIVQTVGFPRAVIEFDAPRRGGGRSKYSVVRLVMLSLSAIASFSNLPLVLGVISGVIVGLFAIAVAVYSMTMKLRGQVVSGYTTIVVLISSLSAIQLFITGLIGQYVGYLFQESKARPLYLVKDAYGAAVGGAPPAAN